MTARIASHGNRGNRGELIANVWFVEGLERDAKLFQSSRNARQLNFVAHAEEYQMWMLHPRRDVLAGYIYASMGRLNGLLGNREVSPNEGVDILNLCES